MAMEWWRSYHGAPLDAKWIIVAKRARAKPGQVAAVWYALQDHASQASPRGSVSTHHTETLATFYGWPNETVGRIKDAFRDLGLVTPDGMLAAWMKRQPKREDHSTERVRRYREKCNAKKRKETQGNGRGEERRGKNTSSIEEVKERRSGDRPARLNFDVVRGGNHAS